MRIATGLPCRLTSAAKACASSAVSSSSSGHDPVDLGPDGVGQRQIQRADALGEMLGFVGPDDRDLHGGVVEHPGPGELGDGRAVGVAHLPQVVDLGDAHRRPAVGSVLLGPDGVAAARADAGLV